MIVLSREEEARRLAQNRSPAGIHARLLISAIDRTPIPPDLEADAGLLIRFAQDSQWPAIRKRALEQMGDIQRRDSTVRDWWGPLFESGRETDGGQG